MTRTDKFSKTISRRGALIALTAPLAVAASVAWWLESDDASQQVGDALEGIPDPPAQDHGSAPPQTPSRGDVRREAVSRATKQLDWAAEESRRLVRECLRPVGAFFDDATQGLPAFAEDTLGWGSKWRLLADYVPWTTHDRQGKYLEERWNEHLFSTNKLTGMLERAAKRCADGVDDIEQEMLVRLRLDVADLQREALPELAAEARLADGFRAAIKKAVEHARADVGHEIGLFVVSEIAERVLAMVVRRLGLSAALLGGGAAAAPYSGGLSLLGAVIINYLLDLVWDWYADPQGELTREIGAQLDRLRTMIIEGDGSTRGLRGELEAYTRRRAKMRARALAELLDPAK